HLIAAEADDDPALLAAIRSVRGLDLSRAGQGERPAPGRRRLDDVERLLVGRQPDAVRSLEREDRFLDQRAVGLRVVDGAAVGIALARLAEVREPEAAGAVEDEIIRPAQPSSIARVVERLELAALGIDDLDAPAPVIVGLGDR